MNYKAYIINNETGEARWSEHPCPDKYDDVQEYQWVDGNYSCDCNRWLFWSRAKGVEPEADVDCGDSRFTVPYLEFEDGKRILIDEESTA